MADSWALRPELALHWRQIDGEWLVYENLSGATHLIDAVSAAVLTCFESSAELAIIDLLTLLAADLAMELPHDQAAIAVRQFVALGLLVPAHGAQALHAAV